MRETCPGDEDVRWVLQIDRREHAPLFQRAKQIDRLADASIGDLFAQRKTRVDGLAREVEHRARALDQSALAARGHRHRPLAVFVDELRQPHRHALSLPLAPTRASISAKMRGSVK